MTWEEAVLGVLARRPRRAWHLQAIYAEIAVLPIVGPHHREHWGSQPNYHHWIRSTVARLKAAGRIKQVSRGTYEIGDA